MATPLTFLYRSHQPPSRPDDVRPHFFDELWEGNLDRAAPFVVPLERVRPGDRQVGAFTTPERLHGAAPPLSLDGLAGFADVESIIGAGPVTLRTPLPSVRELVVTQLDDETLVNLPNLERLSFDRAIDNRPLDLGTLAQTLQQLGCSAHAFGGIEPLARCARLWRLATHAMRPDTVQPLATVSSLRWLDITASTGLRHIGELVQLEVLMLSLDSGSLANLRAWRRLSALRRLTLRSGRVRSLAGIEALESLAEVSLERTAVRDLDPLAELPSLRSLTLDAAIPERQVARMREQRPDVEVRWHGPD